MPRTTSRIAILGTGHMSRALAPHWRDPQRHLIVAGRTPAHVEQLAGDIEAVTADWRVAVAAADVVLLGVHWAGIDDMLTMAGADEGSFADKVLVDCGNPVEIEGFTLMPTFGRSLAQHVQQRTGGRVVKAFNLCHAGVWQRVPDYGGTPLRVPIAGDDEGAKRVVGELVADVGAEPVDVGGLDQAAHLEAMAAVVIRLLFGGADPSTTFNLVASERR
jgi:predicted dinucleotide-binding enzyme